MEKTKEGMMDTPYIYETDITYPDVGMDHRLNHRGLLRILQEAAAIASDERGFGPKDLPRTGVCWILENVAQFANWYWLLRIQL